MESQTKPLPTPVPPAPESPLTAEQWVILNAIADAVIPSLTPLKADWMVQHAVRSDRYNAASDRIQYLAEAADRAGLVTRYMEERASANPVFADHVNRLIAFYMDETSRSGLKFLLGALSTTAGSLLLTGHATTLDKLPIQAREQILLGWAQSRIPALRQALRSLASLVCVFWIRTSATIPEILSYPHVPVHSTISSTNFQFEFIDIPATTALEPKVIETDVVIVGSGCGASVAAKTLAEAGLKVIVVDKAYYWAPKYLPMNTADGVVHLFGNGGVHSSDDSSISVLNGNAWGGGGTVNWSASLQTQGFVRREWSQKFGLTHFETSDFQADLDFVCDRMGVGISSIQHNKGNRVLLDGARKLGWSAKPVPQNTAGEAHNCGYCTLGCGSCGKKGPTETWLPDAAKAGAKFIEGYHVEEVLFASTKNKQGERVTIGVKGVWTSRDSSGGVAGNDRYKRDLIIQAPRVLMGAGPMVTPLILKRSGVKNSHLGRHLHLHPVSVIGATWDEDVRPWEGPILTTVVNEFENMDGEGYGPKLEAVTMIPSMYLPLFPWMGGLNWKEFTVKMRKMTGYISLTRDRYGGRVYADPKEESRSRIAYTPSSYDKRHILEGVARLAELVYVEGAREIFVAVPGIEPYVRPGSEPEANSTVLKRQPSINDADFQNWIKKLRKNGFPSPDTGFASAHQMGTARMGKSPKDGATDHRGRVWGTQGVYVCDTSVFPNASGVNPMITVMAISRGIARGIVDEERVQLSTGWDATAKL